MAAARAQELAKIHVGPLLKKSVKRKIRYHVESLPAADNGFPGHDNPPVRAGPAQTEKNSGKIVKIGFLDSREQNKILKF